MNVDDGARWVLLHAHLFKNAGTTLDWSLHRSFGAAFCDHRDDAAMRGNSQYLADFLKNNPQIRALSSHWLPLPLPQSQQLRLIPLVLLRDPIERILSVYEFERRQAVDHPGTRKARNADLHSYVRWRLETATGPVIRNYQVRMLSGDYPGPDSDDQLQHALDLLDQLPAFGVVDRYRESMVMFEQALGSRFAELDLSFWRQNVRDSADTRSSQERRSDVEKELGDLLAPVRDANRLDIALYEAACRRFAEHWQQVTDRDSLLAQLDARCLRAGDV
ncbi:MAG: hypothetical protein NWP69_10245 [Congregibacter sp.]|nr:hypothetical protein [Congregibacter sp.]